MTPRETLVRAFRMLTRKQRGRLMEHVRRKTPILCGKQADLFAEDGAG